MNKKTVIRPILYLFLLSIISVSNLNAQCGVNNTYFQSGEQMQYDLYVKIGFATTKGGYASLKTESAKYDGKDAYKMTLISESEGLAKKIFSLSDTLACYTTKDLTPLAYLKDAHEGGDYIKERLFYKYPGDGTVKIHTTRDKNNELKFNETIDAKGCTYDLVSILFYSRTLDFSKMKDGDDTKVYFISGKKRGSMKIIYNGKEKTKANDGKSYNCIKLTLYIADEAFNDGKEAMKVYLSDDNNRMPIRLETKLKVGSTRVILKSFSGNKYPLNVAK